MGGMGCSRIIREILRDRDGAVYWLCCQPIDFSLASTEPMGPTIDHVVPLSRGGRRRALSNMRLAHRRCNERRGSDVAVWGWERPDGGRYLRRRCVRRKSAPSA